MTTIESAIMIVWLTARPIVVRAIGSWTLRRTCRPVEPSDVAASTVSDGDAADAQRGEADGGRDRVDQRRDRRPSPLPMKKNSVSGTQVGERRHDLHEVEDRRHDAAGTGRCGRRRSRAGCPTSSDRATATIIWPSVTIVGVPQARAGRSAPARGPTASAGPPGRRTRARARPAIGGDAEPADGVVSQPVDEPRPARRCRSGSA